MSTIENELKELNQFGFAPELVSQLRDLIDTSNYIHHIQALKELSEKGKSILPVMHKLLKSKFTATRKEAIKVVEIIAHINSIPHAINVLRDRESDIRWMGAETLIRIGRASIKPLLKTMVSKGTSYNIRHGAHHVLSELLEEDDPEALKNLVQDLKAGTIDPERIPVEASRIIDQGII